MQKAVIGQERSSINWTTEEGGVYQATSPNAIALVGKIANEDKPRQAGPFELQFQPTSNGHACFTAIALDEKPLQESMNILISVGNRTENTNMKWTKDHNSVGRDWGDAPARVEGVTAQIAIAASTPLTVQALKSNGVPGGTIATVIKSGKTNFPIAPSDQTMWYLLSRE